MALLSLAVITLVPGSHSPHRACWVLLLSHKLSSTLAPLLSFLTTGIPEVNVQTDKRCLSETAFPMGEDAKPGMPISPSAISHSYSQRDTIHTTEEDAQLPDR